MKTGCSNSTMTGSYAVTLNGFGTPPSALARQQQCSSCCLVDWPVTFTDATAGMHFATFVLNGGTELFGVQTDIGTAATLDIKKQ